MRRFILAAAFLAPLAATAQTAPPPSLALAPAPAISAEDLAVSISDELRECMGGKVRLGAQVHLDGAQLDNLQKQIAADNAQMADLHKQLADAQAQLKHATTAPSGTTAPAPTSTTTPASPAPAVPDAPIAAPK